jgi:hypothetical protein
LAIHIRVIDMRDSDVKKEIERMIDNRQDLVYRLRKRAEIRRQIPTRKSVQENQSDRLSDLLDESANEIERLSNMKPFAWYDPSNRHISLDQHDPSFTPLGQLIPLYRQSSNIDAGIDRNTDNKEYSMGTEEGLSDFIKYRNRL